MISREEAIKNLSEWLALAEERGSYYGEEAIPTYKLAIEAISQPERPKGRWIPVPDKLWSYEFKCSCCGRDVYTTVGEEKVTKWYPYCHCGADMREGEEE